MKRELLFCFGLIWTMPCYAAGVIDMNTATDALNFGTAVPMASTSTISVDVNGVPIYMRAMKASTGDLVASGHISFSSSMADGYDNIRIVPDTTTSDYNISSGSNCTLKVTNLSFSPAAILLTQNTKSSSVNVGGAVHINGFCTANYTYNGHILVDFNIYDHSTNELLDTVSVQLPISIRTEHQANIKRDADMNFGKIVSYGTAGTVILNTDGSLQATGGVFSSGNHSAGEISIYGTPNLEIKDVTYPEVIYLHKGSDSMKVTISAPYPGRSFLLSNIQNGQGYEQLKLGGVLEVAEGQPSGDYSNTLPVTIVY